MWCVIIGNVKLNENTFVGQENYDNQLKFGAKTFSELDELRVSGYHFNGIHHQIDTVCCCDWKAGACIEGKDQLNLHNFLLCTR